MSTYSGTFEYEGREFEYEVTFDEGTPMSAASGGSPDTCQVWWRPPWGTGKAWLEEHGAALDVMAYEHAASDAAG